MVVLSLQSATVWCYSPGRVPQSGSTLLAECHSVVVLSLKSATVWYYSPCKVPQCSSTLLAECQSAVVLFLQSARVLHGHEAVLASAASPSREPGGGEAVELWPPREEELGWSDWCCGGVQAGAGGAGRRLVVVGGQGGAGGSEAGAIHCVWCEEAGREVHRGREE